MIVDTSAVIALVANELQAEPIRSALLSAPRALISCGTLAELLIVADNRFEWSLRQETEALLDAAALEAVPVIEEDAQAAAAAYARFGKGNHPARLNLGDCFAYALAKRTGEPLLCVGEDFARTDLPLVPLEAA